MNYCLDTDAIIDYLKGFPSSVDYLRSLDAAGDTLCISDVVVAEVLAGIPETRRDATREFLQSLWFLPMTFAEAYQAGVWRYDYARRGTTLTTTDCLLAALATTHHAALITANTKDFPMPELQLAALPRAQGGGSG